MFTGGNIPRLANLARNLEVRRTLSAVTRRLWSEDHFLLLKKRLSDPAVLPEVPPHVTCRTATSGDLAQILDGWPDEFSSAGRQELASLLAARFRAGVPCYIALREKRLIGAVWCADSQLGSVDLNEDAPRAFEITNWFVDAKLRGQGIGTALNSFALRDMALRGYEVAYSRHYFHRYRAALKSERLGYAPVGILVSGYRAASRRARLVRPAGPTGAGNKPPCLIVAGNAFGSALAVSRSLGEKGVTCFIATVDASTAPFRASKHCADAVRLPSSNEDLASALLLWAKYLRLDPRAPLFPMTDDACLAVAKQRAALSRYCRPVLPGDDVIETMTDKVAAANYAESVGLDAPRSMAVDARGDLATAVQSLRPPVVIKPRRPRNRQIAFKAKLLPCGASAAEYARHVPALNAASAQLVAQEFIGGGDNLVACFMFYRSQDGRRIASWTGRKLRQSPPSAGIMAMGQSRSLPEVERLGRRLVEALDYRGVGGLEFKDRGNGEYAFIEMSVRLEGFHRLAVASGIDLPWRAYVDAADVRSKAGTPEPPPPASEATYFNAQSYGKVVVSPGGLRLALVDLLALWKSPNRVFAVWDLRDPMPWLAANAALISRIWAMFRYARN